MASVNKVILLGNLGADPEVKYTASGKAVAELRLATQGFGKDEPAEWHRVILWERQAEVAGEFLKKGSPVYIEGRIKTRSYDDKDGNKRYVTEIIGERMQLLGRGVNGGEVEAEDQGIVKSEPKKTRKPKKVQEVAETADGDDDPFA